MEMTMFENVGSIYTGKVLARK